MRILPILILMSAVPSANAEIFKCTDRFGQARYQAKPCQESLSEKQLNLKTDPLKQQREDKPRMGAQPAAIKPDGVQDIQVQQSGMPTVQQIPAVSP